jgi:hypothetical protein
MQYGSNPSMCFLSERSNISAESQRDRAYRGVAGSPTPALGRSDVFERTLNDGNSTTLSQEAVALGGDQASLVSSPGLVDGVSR